MDNVIVEENIDGAHEAQGDNVFVEESADGEQKAEIGEEEALKGTTVDTIVKGNTDAELTTRVGKEEASEEIVGSAIVKENTDVERTTQVGEEEALKETTGHIIVEESSDVECTTPVGEEALKEKMCNAIVEESAAQVGEEISRETVGDVMVVECEYVHKAQVSEEVLNKMVSNDIVEESADGEHKTQVGEKEMRSETVGSVIVEESTDGENKAQVGKEEVLNKTLGNLSVEESTDGEPEAQVREAEASNETMGNVIAEESTVGEHRERVDEDEVLNGTVGNVIFEESTDGEHKAEVRKEAAPKETMGGIIIEESTDGELKGEVREETSVNESMDSIEGGTDVEHMAQVREEETNERMDSFMIEKSTDGEPMAQVRKEETLNETEKQAMKYMASGTRTIPLMENDRYVSYRLPSLNKANFSVSDLVWGKVKSHPWWPGQIFDISDATKLAMKYQKKDSFLIGYFGDKTFAWCDESQLKPFHSYFSQLEKQCSSDTFVKAIHDILTEVARRIELGMACSCLSEEDFTNVKYQKVENAGIRGGNINSIINRSTVANYFQPAKLLEYIQTFGQFPNGRVDRLEFVIAQSQLKAFYHSKGYPELPVFTVGGGLVESVPENSPSNGKKNMEDIAEQCTPIPSNSIPAKGRMRSEQSSFNKQGHGFVDDDKHKSVSKLAEVRAGAHLENGGKSTFVAKAAEKPMSSSLGKKHIIVETDPVDSGRCKKRMMDSFEDMELKSPSPTVTSSFKIGEFIRRAASQLTGGSPIVKCQADALQKCGPKAEHKKDDIADFDVFPDSPMGNQTTNLSFIEVDNSTEEMLSQLCLAAGNPMEPFSFVSTIVAFFTGFRNYCVSGSSKEKEHVEKRKRGRPRKAIAELASSDIGSSEDEKHVEKRKRGMLTNVISRLASSEISSEEEKPIEKPVEKRKRGRPRKNPQPASSDSSEDKKPVQKPQRGRTRGRPKKVDTQLAFPDYSSSENKKPNEKRKRGRPRKVNTEIAPSDMPMKDSYWSDMDLKQKRNGKGHVQYRRKRRKSTGEQSLPLPANPVHEIEQQLQLIAMNPNLKLTFIEERSIVSVEEKIVDECMPTALILSFNNANSLPSETDLIRIFSRYGPLKEAETDVLRKTNRAKVVFKRRVDAETAFSSAGKYSTFGPGLLSYQLKPWTSRSTLQGTLQGTQDAASTLMLQGAQDAASILMPQDTHDVAPIATPQENPDVVSVMTPSGNHNAAPIVTPHDNHDTAFTATPLDKRDLGSITTAQDHHDLAPITMVLDDDDAAVVITPQYKCDTGPTAQSNLEFSEQAEAVIGSDAMQIKAENVESLPYDKQDPVSNKSQQGNQDVVPVASSLDVCDLAPTSIQNNMEAAPITIVQDNYDAAGVITIQEKYVVGPSVGSTLELSARAEDVIASDTKQVEAEGKESSSPNDNSDPALFATPQENQVSVQDCHDLAPVAAVQDNTHSVAFISLQEKRDAEPTTGSNSKPLEQAEDVITSDPILVVNDYDPEQPEDVIMPDTIQAEAEGKKSLPENNHDPAVSASEQNQDTESIPSLPDKDDSTPSTTVDNLDAAPISMPLDNHDPEHVTTAQNNHDEVSITTPPNHPVASITTPQDNQHTTSIATLDDKHDLAPITQAEDSHSLAPITMVEDNHDATAIFALEDKCDAGPTLGSNLGIPEQAKDVIASGTLRGDKEPLPEAKHNPPTIDIPQQNQGAESVASPVDKLDSSPTIKEDDLDGVPIDMPEDNHDAAPITTPQDTIDAAITGGGYLEVSESEVASETIQAEPEGCKLEASEQIETGMASDAMQA